MSFRIIRPQVPQMRGTTSPFQLMLMSDLHLGASNTDIAAIESDLKEAKKNEARININGDLFDAILPKDVKRYRPEALHPDLQGRSDVLNAAISMAYDVLHPYRFLIDFIGWGNHEASVSKYHGIDPVSSLCTLLRAAGSNLEHGGYTGFVDYRLGFKNEKGKGDNTKNRVVVYYHHGSGGSSPVTKGMIDFARKLAWVDADIIWLGHKHNRLVDSTPQRLRCPLGGIEPIYEPQICIMTGAYMTPYVGQTDASITSEGYRSTYASEVGYAPQGKGGARVLVYLSGGGTDHRGKSRGQGLKRIQVVN